MLVSIHSDFVKMFDLNELVFTEQEALPDGSGIVMKFKRLSDDFKEKGVTVVPATVTENDYNEHNHNPS